MTAANFRVYVRRNADYVWPWTAWFEHWDGEDWIDIEHESGDTPEEAIDELAQIAPRTTAFEAIVQADA